MSEITTWDIAQKIIKKFCMGQLNRSQHFTCAKCKNKIETLGLFYIKREDAINTGILCLDCAKKIVLEEEKC